MNDEAIEIALYTKDENLAYKLRTKYNSNTVEIKYVSDFGNLALHLLSGKGGIVVFDLKCVQFLNLLSAFAHFRNNGEFIFVYLTDDVDEVEINDFNSFVCKYDEVGEFVHNIKFRLFDVKNYLNEKRDSFYKRMIIKTLEEYKISPKHIGFDYLKDSVQLALNYKDVGMYLNKTIYPQVAQMYNTTVQNVEKSIRLAIKRATTLYPEVYNIDVFKNSKVTNRTFVAYIAKKVENANLKDFV